MRSTTVYDVHHDGTHEGIDVNWSLQSDGRRPIFYVYEQRGDLVRVSAANFDTYQPLRDISYEETYDILHGPGERASSTQTTHNSDLADVLIESQMIKRLG